MGEHRCDRAGVRTIRKAKAYGVISHTTPHHRCRLRRFRKDCLAHPAPGHRSGTHHRSLVVKLVQQGIGPAAVEGVNLNTVPGSRIQGVGRPYKLPALSRTRLNWGHRSYKYPPNCRAPRNSTSSRRCHLNNRGASSVLAVGGGAIEIARRIKDQLALGFRCIGRELDQRIKAGGRQFEDGAVVAAAVKRCYSVEVAGPVRGETGVRTRAIDAIGEAVRYGFRALTFE